MISSSTNFRTVFRSISCSSLCSKSMPFSSLLVVMRCPLYCFFNGYPAFFHFLNVFSPWHDLLRRVDAAFLDAPIGDHLRHNGNAVSRCMCHGRHTSRLVADRHHF